MKKHLFKICIGSVAFAVFIAVGYPKLSVNQNQAVPQKEKRGLITRNGSGHYTRNTSKSYKKFQSGKYANVIYIGEPTEGLLD